jgi:hypothetical protein
VRRVTKLKYRVWEAQIPGETATSLVAVSDLREISLRREISSGERQLKLLRLVAETENRNQARQMADCEI